VAVSCEYSAFETSCTNVLGQAGLAGWHCVEAQMPNQETPAERYRRLAAECSDVANNFPRGEHRDALLQMGHVWQRLAESSRSLPWPPARPGRRPRQSEKSDHRHCWLLRVRNERPRTRHAAQRGYEFSPSDTDCHVTLPWGHATGRTISHANVLRCGISNRPMSARGHRSFGDVRRTTALTS
jgi:hypothetical protein